MKKFGAIKKVTVNNGEGRVLFEKPESVTKVLEELKDSKDFKIEKAEGEKKT